MKQVYLSCILFIISFVVSVTVIVTKTVYLPINQLNTSNNFGYLTPHRTNAGTSSGGNSKLMTPNYTSIVKVPKLNYHFQEGHLILGNSGEKDEAQDDCEQQSDYDTDCDTDTDYDTDKEISEIRNPRTQYYNSSKTIMRNSTSINNTMHWLTSKIWSKPIRTSSSPTLNSHSQTGKISEFSSFTWPKSIVSISDDQHHFSSYLKNSFSSSIVSSNSKSKLNLSYNTEGSNYYTTDKTESLTTISNRLAGKKTYSQIKTISVDNQHTTYVTKMVSSSHINVEPSAVFKTKSPLQSSVVYSTPTHASTTKISVSYQGNLTTFDTAKVDLKRTETSLQLYNSSQQTNNKTVYSTKLTNVVNTKSLDSFTKSETRKRTTKGKKTRTKVSSSITTTLEQSIIKSLVSLEFTRSFSLLKHNNTLLLNDQLSRGTLINLSPIIFLIIIILL